VGYNKQPILFEVVSERQKLIQMLPPPSFGKHGWPWMGQPPKLPPLTPSGKAWPKISIVTPSYNQGRFLEETIRSVLMQGYPNLEYIIMDGGSTDNSVEIIKKYEPWLTSWVSEKDNGQADAIHRGFEKATGEIIGWLNSDDYLLSGALKKVGKAFVDETEQELIIGGGIVVDERGTLLRKSYSFPQNFTSLLSLGQFAMQMSSFWRRDAYRAVGGLDSTLHFCFDYDLFIRLAKRKPPSGIDDLLSAFRIHGESKTSTIWETVALPEIEVVKRRYFSKELTEEQCQALFPQLTREYHLDLRRNIVKDVLRDPVYFFTQLKRKIKSLAKMSEKNI